MKKSLFGVFACFLMGSTYAINTEKPADNMALKNEKIVACHYEIFITDRDGNKASIGTFDDENVGSLDCLNKALVDVRTAQASYPEYEVSYTLQSS